MVNVRKQTVYHVTLEEVEGIQLRKMLEKYLNDTYRDDGVPTGSTLGMLAELLGSPVKWWNKDKGEEENG